MQTRAALVLGVPKTCDLETRNRAVVHLSPLTTYASGGEGGGWGRRVQAVPVGVIEVSNQQTRFVPITDRKKLGGVLLAGIGLGMWLGWRRRR